MECGLRSTRVVSIESGFRSTIAESSDCFGCLDSCDGGNSSLFSALWVGIESDIRFLYTPITHRFRPMGFDVDSAHSKALAMDRGQRVVECSHDWK
jgi:hypothetical protein